jgi:hypothetical protein
MVAMIAPSGRSGVGCAAYWLCADGALAELAGDTASARPGKGGPKRY